MSDTQNGRFSAYYTRNINSRSKKKKQNIGDSSAYHQDIAPQGQNEKHRVIKKEAK